jgi:hypothetical protein
MVINTGKYFPHLTLEPTMNHGGKPPDFQERWAVVITALKRLMPDAEVKRLLANHKLAQIVEEAVDESSLPQLQTLSWLRSLLLRLSRGERDGKNPCSRCGMMFCKHR